MVFDKGSNSPGHPSKEKDGQSRSLSVRNRGRHRRLSEKDFEEAPEGKARPVAIPAGTIRHYPPPPIDDVYRGTAERHVSVRRTAMEQWEGDAVLPAIEMQAHRPAA